MTHKDRQGCTRRAALGALAGLPALATTAGQALGQEQGARPRAGYGPDDMGLRVEAGNGRLLAARGVEARAVPAHELGLLPDRLRDQSQELERAIRRAAELGMALRLPPGDVVAGDVELRQPVRLVGDADSRLVCRAGARRLLRVRGTARCELLGVRIDGAGQQRAMGQEQADGLLMLEDIASVRVVDCIIEQARGHGLFLRGCGGLLVGNRLRDVAETALFALDCQALEITHNDIMHCGNGGILVWQSVKRHDGALVARNRIRRIRADAGGTGQNGNGINVFRGGGVRVVDNDIAECAYSSVRDNSGDEVVIARNICRRSGEVAIFVEFTFERALVAGNLVEGATAGISVTNMKEGGRLATVTGNIVRDLIPVRGLPGEEGYGIGVEADSTVTGNVVERAAKYGIALGWGKYLRNVTATGNVVRQSPVGVAVSVVKGAGRAVISANVFDEVRIAVAGYDHARRVTGELLGARRAPRHVLINANSKG